MNNLTTVLAKNIVTPIRKHRNELIVAIGLTSLLSGTMFAIHGTIKAVNLVDNRKNELSVDKLDNKEIVKTVWKCYIPTLIADAVGVGCVIGAASSQSKKNAALAVAYTMSDSALHTYRAKVIETLGEKGEKKIHDAIAKDQVEKHPVVQNEIILTNKGDTLCFDALSGRYFRSDIDKIKKAVNEVNKIMINDMFVSLNDFYYELGLSSVSVGEDLGWNINHNLMDVSFSAQLTEDGNPCLVMNYSIAPRYDYTEL